MSARKKKKPEWAAPFSPVSLLLLLPVRRSVLFDDLSIRELVHHGRRSLGIENHRDPHRAWDGPTDGRSEGRTDG